MLFVGIFILRLAVADPDAAILLLCAAPIVLVASELGLWAGLTAAVLSIGLLIAWMQNEAVTVGAAGYATRAGTFLLVGVLVGWLTDRHRALEHQSSRHFELSLDILGAAGFDGHFKRVNPGFEKTLGYDAEEFCSRPFLDFVHPDDRERTEAEAAKLAEVGTDTIDFQNRYRAKDGSYRWIEWTATADASEQLLYVAGRDVTERRAADDLRFHLAAIVDSSDDAILSKALDGTISSWNKGAERLYGYAAQEIVGKPISQLVPDDRPYEVKDILRGIRAGEVIDHFETERVGKDGSVIPVSLTISPIKNSADEIVGASTIARDTRERKRLEAELEASLDAALAASRLKSEFVANMSHEVRTPMNGVIGMSELLLDTDLDVRQRSYTRTLRSSAEGLLTIINDILDFSKIEAGKLELEEADFNLHTAVEEAAELLGPSAGDKGLELAVMIEPDVPELARGDRLRLRQVLTNLAANAIKFTEEGEVLVRVACVERTSQSISLRIEVKDTGIGIEPSGIERLFESFTQADASTTRNHGGSGLGLTISQQLVELMDGEIGAESTPGEGTTFWFTIRLGTCHTPPRERQRRLDLSGLRVLVVDDNATNREILETHLRSWGMEPQSAVGAAHALDLLGAATTFPDLAILDFQMPGMDGIDLARLIRAEPALESMRLLILSSVGMKDASAAEAGIDALLTKPVRRSLLFDSIASVMAGDSMEPEGLGGNPEGFSRPAPDYADLPTVAASSAPEEEGGDGRVDILVAEDNAVNQMVAVLNLEKRGYRVHVAGDGHEAIELLARTPYAAVLMDCQMPKMDGYEATAAIRRREGTGRHIPIIAMTAHAMKGDRDKCIVAGMDDYLSKPLRADALDVVLARWAPLKAPTVPDGAKPGVSRDDLLDRAVIAEVRTGIPTEALLMVIDTFEAEIAKLAPEISDAVRAGDGEALKDAAHALKGASANLGAAQVAHLSGRLEELAHVGDFDGAPALAEELARSLRDTPAALRAELSH